MEGGKLQALPQSGKPALKGLRTLGIRPGPDPGRLLRRRRTRVEPAGAGTYNRFRAGGALSVSDRPPALGTGCPTAISRGGLNGKQVRCLCCPRNGKRAWFRHDATERGALGKAADQVLASP